MRKVVVKAYGIKRTIDISSLTIEEIEKLNKAKDFEVIEYKEVANEENNKNN